MALAAVTNGGWWLLWSRQKLGSAGVGSATAQAETGMRRAAAVVGGCYSANRGSGSDQGSVVVRARLMQVAVVARVTQGFALGGRM